MHCYVCMHAPMWGVCHTSVNAGWVYIYLEAPAPMVERHGHGPRAGQQNPELLFAALLHKPHADHLRSRVVVCLELAGSLLHWLGGRHHSIYLDHTVMCDEPSWIAYPWYVWIGLFCVDASSVHNVGPCKLVVTTPACCISVHSCIAISIEDVVWNKFTHPIILCVEWVIYRIILLLEQSMICCSLSGTTPPVSSAIALSIAPVAAKA